jgi:dTDP-4-amino-4,6-dideoxygalactose transaminase
MRKVGLGIFNANNTAKDLVYQVLESGRISYGPLCNRLEHDLSAIHGARYGVLSNSGTSSLHVALQAAKELNGWPDGFEVLVPAVTFVATANVVLHNKLKPILVDVESDYYGMNPDDAYEQKTDNTCCIMPVNLFGMPCQMNELEQIAFDEELCMITDSCETMFATFNQRRIGEWGDISCFSTYVAHLISTGVGGMAITNLPRLASKMRSLVNHGRDGIYISIDDDDKAAGDNLKEIVSRRFNFESIGHSFRITEIEAALALAQLEDWQNMIATRQRNAYSLSDCLFDWQDYLQLPKIRPGATHSFMMYPIVLKRGDKWDLCNYLESKGIETREMLPLTEQPCYRGMWNPRDYPVAQNINRMGFYVGCHQGLTEDDMMYVGESIIGYFKSVV